MCIGHRYCHEDVANLGFQNYNDVFDLSFDTEDRTTRMYSAIKNNQQRLADLVDIDHLSDKINQNFDYLMGDYADSIRARAEEDLKILFEKR
jgi:hypothetical protein